MPNSSKPGQEPCPCDNLKYGPPDANGRRSIFIPETAWADEPMPPMPRDYGLAPSRTESRGMATATAPERVVNGAQGVTKRPYRPQQEMPDPGQVWAEYPNQSMFIEPSRSTNPNVCYLPGPQPEQRSTFLGDSAAGGPFGSKTLAELGIVSPSANDQNILLKIDWPGGIPPYLGPSMGQEPTPDKQAALNGKGYVRENAAKYIEQQAEAAKEKKQCEWTATVILPFHFVKDFVVKSYQFTIARPAGGADYAKLIAEKAKSLGKDAEAEGLGSLAVVEFRAAIEASAAIDPVVTGAAALCQGPCKFHRYLEGWRTLWTRLNDWSFEKPNNGDGYRVVKNEDGTETVTVDTIKYQLSYMVDTYYRLECEQGISQGF